MWKRTVEIGLVAFGLLAAFIPAKNLWTIRAAWYDLDSKSLAGIEFLWSPSVAETLRNLWTENLITLFGSLLIAISGFIVLLRSKPR